MRRDLARHLEECRRRGLHVDEDFEKGRGRLRRLARAITLSVLMAAFIATVVAIARPSLIDTLFAPAVMPAQTHRPDGGVRPHFRRAIVRARAPRALA